MTGNRTVARLTRPARGALIALVLAVVWAAPAAATQPTRTRSDLTGAGIFAADESGCGFAIGRTWDPGSWVTVTDFSDGSEVVEQHSVATLTNIDNGKTFVRKHAYRDMEWFDAEAGVIRGVQSGQFTWTFLPGDMGPFGLVGAPGLGVYLEGTASYTWDPTVNAITEFAFQGSITDVCALLA